MTLLVDVSSYQKQVVGPVKPGDILVLDGSELMARRSPGVEQP